ncbi:MAG: AsnC family protein [Magnetospirillum sp. WYHS-4]
MELTAKEKALVTALGGGLPLVSDPYAELGRRVGLSEGETIAVIARLREAGLIKRFGVVVRHHELGYRSNAMVVWDIPDARVEEIGRRFSAFDFVTLCYQRPRRPPEWPYNLFCMVHGRERDVVLGQVEELAETCGLAGVKREVLFSTRRFKQRGAVYCLAPETAA